MYPHWQVERNNSLKAPKATTIQLSHVCYHHRLHPFYRFSLHCTIKLYLLIVSWSCARHSFCPIPLVSSLPRSKTSDDHPNKLPAAQSKVWHVTGVSTSASGLSMFLPLPLTHSTAARVTVAKLLHKCHRSLYPHHCDSSRLHYYCLARIASHPRLDHPHLGRPHFGQLPHAWSRERMESPLPHRLEDTST